MYYNYQVPFYRNQVDVGNKHILKVIGEGIVSATPNQATATIGVITDGKVLTQVQKQNSEIISRVINELSAFSIPEENIQTFDYHVNSEYDFVDGKRIFRGYRVQTLLKVTVPNINELGSIINRIIEAGANYVSNVQFSVLNPNEYYLQALKKALDNAKAKATTIVKDLNVQWDVIPVRIHEVGKQTSPIQPEFAMVKGISSDQFQPGQLQFHATLHVKYHYYK